MSEEYAGKVLAVEGAYDPERLLNDFDPEIREIARVRCYGRTWKLTLAKAKEKKRPTAK